MRVLNEKQFMDVVGGNVGCECGYLNNPVIVDSVEVCEFLCCENEQAQEYKIFYANRAPETRHCNGVSIQRTSFGSKRIMADPPMYF